MDIDIKKYTSKKKGPNSIAGEQLEIAVNITGKGWGQISGLTKHLSVQDIFLLNKESKNNPKLWWSIFKQKYSTNNMSKLMEEKLREFPAFRERKNRDVYLAKWTLRDIQEEKDQRDSLGNLKKSTLLAKQKRGEVFTMNELGKFGLRFSSLDRTWRQTLADPKNAGLRGKDYDEGEELENKKLRELGYDHNR